MSSLEDPNDADSELEETAVIEKPVKVSFLHENCGPGCDCKQAKQRRKRAEAVPAEDRVYVTKPHSKISLDWLDSYRNNGTGNERYGLVLNDEGSKVNSFFPTVNRKTASVCLGLRNFLGSKISEVKELFSDNAEESAPRLLQGNSISLIQRPYHYVRNLTLEPKPDNRSLAIG